MDKDLLKYQVNRLSRLCDSLIRVESDLDEMLSKVLAYRLKLNDCIYQIRTELKKGAEVEPLKTRATFMLEQEALEEAKKDKASFLNTVPSDLVKFQKGFKRD